MQLINSKECEDYLRTNWKKSTMHMQESVYAVFLNAFGKRIKIKRIAKGRFSKCEPDIFLMMHHARKHRSNYMVLAHNHPCGDTKPSQGDIDFTKDVHFALSLCDIVLLDHIILTDNSYFSFKDAGLLPVVGYRNAG